MRAIFTWDNWAYGINPMIEFSWKTEGIRVVHAFELGCMIWLKDITAHDDYKPFGKQFIPQIKYKAMWKLN